MSSSLSIRSSSAEYEDAIINQETFADRETEAGKAEDGTTDDTTEDERKDKQGIQSLFLKLAPELRVMIYELVFTKTRLTYGAKFYYPQRAFGYRTRPHPRALALLKTCRLIR